MEKSSKFNLFKLSNFFTSSCKTQNLAEVIDHTTPHNPIFLHSPLMQEHHDNEDDLQEEKYPFRKLTTKHKLMTSFSSYYQASSSTSSLMMCKPRCPETFDQMIRESCIYRRNVAGKYSLLSPAGDIPGRRCPPSSPASPLFREQGRRKEKEKRRKGKAKTKTKATFGSDYLVKNGFKSNPFDFSSNESNDNGDWFSSDDEREDYGDNQTMFSLKSMSLSSDSEQTQTRTQAQAQTQTRSRRPRRRKASSISRPKEVGVMPIEGKVKDTFAVVKSSSDPYHDFRTSMVEMIIEKQIFGAKELEELLKCFLSLNSSHHHKVIVEVFTEICDALFSHCS